MIKQYETTVKMETLCSRFYAVISGTSGDIDMGSSGECLECNKTSDILHFDLRPILGLYPLDYYCTEFPF